ncbi:hypothetical protein [Streptomyces macrolidinus]|uniref:hypothetical protein n=1 Tax=Streptomyces macrolidinus TaxID=2952607 RepID=UPI0027E30EC5|nr:hypothetical protein [Streptomyces macrolidinus]
MMPAGRPFDWALAEVAVPRPPGHLPGVRMAGFSQRAPATVDIAMVAHPSVALLIDLSETEGLVHHLTGTGAAASPSGSTPASSGQAP